MTSITAPVTAFPRPSTRLRLTVRGRRVLAALVAAPVAVALGFAILAGGSALASREGSAPAGTYTTVTVAAGQTLWSVAEEVAPNADPRDVVDALVRLNALGGAQVAAGQQLAIPAEYAPAR